MFAYNYLKDGTSDIRLVRFKQPAQFDLAAASIELELQHASFDNDTHYAALSYVWGHPDTRTAAQVHINGCSFTIGSNLHAALTQLYRGGVRSWLWVDSICINQSDMEEKSVQVAQMRTIFSLADRVYVWLGPGSIETAIAMDFATRIGTRALAVGVLDLWSNKQLWIKATQNIKRQASIFEIRDHNEESSIFARVLTDFILDILREPDLQKGPLIENGSLRDPYDESSILARELSDFILDILREPDLQGDSMLKTGSRSQSLAGSLRIPYTHFKKCSLARGIMELMQLEYWHRIWVIQEISLAQEATVLCGEKAIPIEAFDATFYTLSHCIQLFRRLHEPQYFAYGLFANFYESIALSTRRKLRRQDPSEKVQLASIVFQDGAPPGRPHYSATDARDIVFGLLGVATDAGSLGLRVDYNMTVAEVFTALTRALIYDEDKNRKAYHLDDCVPRQKEDSSDSLPSWVPDWRVIGIYGPGVHSINCHGTFNATAGIPKPPRPRNCSGDDTRGLLRCSGCCVDVITDVMEPPHWQKGNEWAVSTIVDVEAWLNSIYDFAKLGPESGPGEDYVWRTIMLDFYDGITGPKSFEETPIDDERASIIRKIMRRKSIVVESLTEAQRDYIRYGPFHWLNFDTLDQKLEDLETEWPRDIGDITRGRTLFKTTKGMFGLGHTAIQPGDTVSLLWGIRSPIILRTRDDEAGGGFTFVGDAYVDGIMYGEFLKTAPAHKDFEIY